MNSNSAALFLTDLFIFVEWILLTVGDVERI